MPAGLSPAALPRASCYPQVSLEHSLGKLVAFTHCQQHGVAEATREMLNSTSRTSAGWLKRVMQTSLAVFDPLPECLKTVLRFSVFQAIVDCVLERSPAQPKACMSWCDLGPKAAKAPLGRPCSSRCLYDAGLHDPQTQNKSFLND